MSIYIYIYVCISIYLSIYLSFYLSFYLSIYCALKKNRATPSYHPCQIGIFPKNPPAGCAKKDVKLAPSSPWSLRCSSAEPQRVPEKSSQLCCGRKKWQSNGHFTSGLKHEPMVYMTKIIWLVGQGHPSEK